MNKVIEQNLQDVEQQNKQMALREKLKQSLQNSKNTEFSQHQIEEIQETNTLSQNPQELNSHHWQNQRKYHPREESYDDNIDLIKIQIQKLGYEEKMEKLKSMGFQDLKLNFQALQQSDGDESKALDIVLEKAEKIQKQFIQNKNTDHRRKLGQGGQFESQNKFLIANGYNYPMKNFQALVQFDGNQERALQFLEKVYPTYKIMDNELQVGIRQWDPKIKKVFIDGNNTMNVEKQIRIMINSQESRMKQTATNCLIELAYGVACTQDIEIYLYFDETQQSQQRRLKLPGDSSKNQTNIQYFYVLTAKPFFNSADEALVNEIKEIPVENRDQVMVVTSDDLLQFQLQEAGCQMIMGSGSWFQFMRQTLSLDQFHQIIKTQQETYNRTS